VPEGDTIFRLAGRLRPALVGQPVEHLVVHRHRGPQPTGDSAVESVASVGKHLLIGLTGGWVLDSHLRMNGRWQLVRPDEAPTAATGGVRAVVVTPTRAAVLSGTPAVGLWHPRAPEVRPWLRLGPDLCREPVDLAEIGRRARLLPAGADVAELLLDQRVAAGVGNVYKSEVAWAEEIDPRRPAASLTDAQVEALFERARRLLRRNLGTDRRTTHGRGYAVYGRAGRLCPRCGARIVVDRQGDLERITYRCPACQT
jgi:endonuclease VIII